VEEELATEEVVPAGAEVVDRGLDMATLVEVATEVASVVGTTELIEAPRALEVAAVRVLGVAMLAGDARDTEIAPLAEDERDVVVKLLEETKELGVAMNSVSIRGQRTRRVKVPMTARALELVSGS
jgi:hypothetical protein